MVNFISNSKISGDPGFLFSCSGNLYVSSYGTRNIVVCSTNASSIVNTYIYDLEHRSEGAPLFVPRTVSNQTNKFPGTDIDQTRASQYLYTTQGYRISGLISYGTVVSTSKTEPLILYYTYNSGTFTLSTYNWHDKITTPILQQSVNVDNIQGCSFLLGRFVSATSSDVLVSCNLLGIVNQFYIQKLGYQKLDLNLSNWCSNPSLIKLADFNGDKFSDLFCASTRQAMINGKSGFAALNLNDLPGNWNSQIVNNNFAIGDFDGNGLSDLVSIAANYNPEVLFRTNLNSFISLSPNQDGSFGLNALNTWCSNSSTSVNFLSLDLDNDSKDDILCQDNTGNVYGALSKNSATNLTASSLNKISIKLSNFHIGSNVKYSISQTNAPLICDMKRVYEYNTKFSCMLDSPNKVNSFTLPTTPSIGLSQLEVKASIKDTIILDKYGDINTNLDHLHDLHDLKVPSSKLWKIDSVNYNDPAREFNTESKILYSREFQATNTNKHLASQKYGFRTAGGACYRIEFSHITMTNKFIAQGVMEAYDNNNTLIKNTETLQDLARLYVSGAQVQSAEGGVVLFSYQGEITMTTLYQKNVTYCGATSFNVPSSSYYIDTSTSTFPSSLCMLQTVSSHHRSGEVIIARSDLIELNGCAFVGGSFYPQNIKNATIWSNYSQALDDITATMSFVLQNSDEIQLKAYVLTFPDSPKAELRVQFIQNNQIIYEPSGPNTLYAAFESIKNIKLAAFSPIHAILAWAIYQENHKQYYILVDYLNSGNNLLRIASLSSNFQLIVPTTRYGDEFFIAYQPSLDKIAITKYQAGDFSPSSSIIIDVAPEPNTEYNLSEVSGNELAEKNIKLVITHGNNKGIFVYTYDIYLNQIDTANILCPTENPNHVATQIDDAPVILQLNYPHDSKTLYATLAQNIQLQNTLEFIYNGLTQLDIITRDQGIMVQVSNTLSNIVCQSTMTYEYIGQMTSIFKSYLESDLTFKYESQSTTHCLQGNEYNSVYRINQTIHICNKTSGIDTLDPENACMDLLNKAGYVRGMIEPNIQAETSTLAQYLPYFPSNVLDTFVRIVNGENVDATAKTTVCSTIDSNGNTDSDILLLASSVVAGIWTNSPQLEQILEECNTMASRSCSNSGDKETSTLCLSHFLEIAGLAYIVTESGSMSGDSLLSCDGGCNL